MPWATRGVTLALRARATGVAAEIAFEVRANVGAIISNLLSGRADRCAMRQGGSVGQAAGEVEAAICEFRVNKFFTETTHAKGSLLDQVGVKWVEMGHFGATSGPNSWRNLAKLFTPA